MEVQWTDSMHEADLVLLPMTQPSSVSSTPIDFAGQTYPEYPVRFQP